MSSSGLYGPADFQAPITTHLDTAWWARMLAFYADQEIVGAQFRAEVPLAAVLNPHLLSVAAAADKIDNEHTRFADCGYYGVSPDLPFFPRWLTAQGSVPKSDGHARPVQDVSMPREDLFYVNGEPVVSINVASGAGRRERDAAIAAGAEPKWPHEVKPTTADSMHDDAILLHAALYVWHAPVCAMMDDERDSFMQHNLAASELHKACFLWRRRLDAPDAGDLEFLDPQCLTYGFATASNIKQRVAWALTAIVEEIFDAEEAVLFALETDPARRAYIAERAEVSLRTGRNELRLYAARIYTDDCRFAAVGVDRQLRLLRVWRRVTLEFGLRMAAPEKRGFGVSGIWLGVMHAPPLGSPSSRQPSGSPRYTARAPPLAAAA